MPDFIRACGTDGGFYGGVGIRSDLEFFVRKRAREHLLPIKACGVGDII